MKKIIFSGIQPSGIIHIGNYLGAIKNWVKLQDNSDQAYFCIVDYHAITSDNYNAQNIQDTIYTNLAIYLACGLDPKKAVIFQQSDVTEHTELAWVLNTSCSIGELRRMTQFKDKMYNLNEDSIEDERKKIISEFDSLLSRGSKIYKKVSRSFKKTDAYIAKFADYIAREKGFGLTKVGLFNYPVLQAADILLYKTTSVPVGEDQQQHIEITRDIAEKFNKKFKPIFQIPEPYITSGSKIMALNNPEKKMSKSIENSYISLTDSPEIIFKRIMSAVSDSSKDGTSPGGKNLLLLLELIADKKVFKKHADRARQNKLSYSELKQDLAEAMIEFIKPIQSKTEEFLKDKSKLDKILADGAIKAKKVASKTMLEAREALGLYEKRVK